MPYSELVKNFEHVRDYMRQFFAYGFRTRAEYDRKSARSYDNERRRIESWMGDYMDFRTGENGKNVFLSVNTRTLDADPLYKAFKARSFTTGDIMFHFLIADILSEDDGLTLREILDRMAEYLSVSSGEYVPDESSVRKKLKEYAGLGLVRQEKQGKEVLYYKETDHVDLASWGEALDFYSEENALGVIGSYAEDRLSESPAVFRFKHHYILHALESEIVLSLLTAMNEGRKAQITFTSRRKPDTERTFEILPMKLYMSTQNGREHLLAYDYRFRAFQFFRIDSIHSVEIGEPEAEIAAYRGRYHQMKAHIWGTSMKSRACDHLEMTVRADETESFIADRLSREKRNGTVEAAGEGLWRYSVDCYDALELLPWIRTFTGRIVSLVSTNSEVLLRFREDLARMAELYGGEADAVQ